MGGIIEIILKLLPVIIELIGEKAKAGHATTVAAAMACWQNSMGRTKFNVQVLLGGITKGILTTPQEVTEALVALEAFADSDAVPVFLSTVYGGLGDDNASAMSSLVDTLKTQLAELSQAA